MRTPLPTILEQARHTLREILSGGDSRHAREPVNGATATSAWDHLALGGLGAVLGDGQAEYVPRPGRAAQMCVW